MTEIFFGVNDKFHTFISFRKIDCLLSDLKREICRTPLFTYFFKIKGCFLYFYPYHKPIKFYRK